MSIVEWESLPWYEQRLYREGLAREIMGLGDEVLVPQFDDSPAPPLPEQEQPPAETPEENRKRLSGWGIRVREVAV